MAATSACATVCLEGRPLSLEALCDQDQICCVPAGWFIKQKRARVSQDLLPTASTPLLCALSILEHCALQDPLLGRVLAGSVLAACKKDVDMHSHVPCKAQDWSP